MQHVVSRAGSLTLTPYVIKTDLFGPESDGQRVAAELGRLLVPERRSNPERRLIELAFVRLQSTAKRPGPPLVFLAGGPGISGIDGMRWDKMLPWFLALREVGDVIALDQRGTGFALPRLDCLERWELPLDQPGTRAEALRIGMEQSRKCVQFWQERGVDLLGYTTEESADDLNDLRKALGVEQINLYGASYGSHLALATIKRHGEHIGRAVIAMVEGLDHTIKLPSNIQRHMEDLAQFVAQDARLRGAIPDFLGLIGSVLGELERRPVTVEVADEVRGGTVSVCVSKFDLQLLTASGIGSRRFLANLPARYAAMAHRDFSWVGKKVLERRQEWMGNAMSYMMDCASGVSPERLERVYQEAAGTLLEDLINFPFPEIGEAWGAPDLGPAFRAPFVSKVPALFLSGTLDGRTPVSNAEEVRAGFPQSQHVIIEGGTHATAELVNAAGVTETILDFLRGQDVTQTRATIPFRFSPLTEG